MTRFYDWEKNRPIFFWSLIILFLEFLSFLGWQYSILSYFFLFGIFVLLFLAYQRQNQNMIILPLLELFWGSMGRSLQVGFFSLRWLVFATTILYFLWINRLAIAKLQIWSNKKLAKLFLIYIFLILFISVLGFYNGHSLKNIFLDANAYLFILYLPIWYQYFDKDLLSKIKNILLASTAIVAIKTLLVFFYFVQIDSNAPTLYKWLRDSRVGEMTFLDNGFVRIFFQSQLYLLLAWFIIFRQALQSKMSGKYILFLTILLAAIYISLSRSYWLALFVILLIIFFTSKQYLKFIKYFIFISALSVALVLLLFNFPRYHTIDLLANRSVSGQEAAISSRAQLWPVMLKAIGQSPIIGHGFGQELSFYSNDPRSKNAQNPQGERTTFSFEWGWLDFMVKAGLLLPLFFVYWLFYLFLGTYGIIRSKPQFWPYLAFLVALPIIHIFSPYLNHPLGLGWLILQTVVISKNA